MSIDITQLVALLQQQGLAAQLQVPPPSPRHHRHHRRHHHHAHHSHPPPRGAAVLAGTKLYHETDRATADIILRTQQMKPGSSGLAGGGIYFATSPEHTGHKAHKTGVILEATVALGKILTLDANGDPSMTLQKLKAMGFDSVCIARSVSSGQEYVVYDPVQVLSIEETDQHGSALPRYFPPPAPAPPPPPPRRPPMRVPAYPHRLSADPSQQSHGAGGVLYVEELPFGGLQIWY